METESEDIKLFSKKGILVFGAIFYLSSLIYGLIIMRNLKWAKDKTYIAITIYSIIIIFDVFLWYILIKYKFLRSRTRISNNQDNNETQWYQMIDIGEISRVIQSNFEITEEVDINQNIDDNLETPEVKKCVICDEIYSKTDNNIKYIKLNCNHDFCEECISQWCIKKNSCPMCRSEIINQSHLEVV